MKKQGISGLILAAAAVVAVSLPCRASEIDLLLGAASNFGVLSLTGGVNMSGGSVDGGNVGVASVGQQLQMSGGATVTGFADVNTGSKFQSSGGAKVEGGVNQNAATNSYLQTAYLNAYAASAAAAAMHGTNISLPDGNDTITESTAGNYVFDVSSISLSGNHSLMIDAPAGSTVTLNISGNMSLSGSAEITVGGGLTASDILLNVLGHGSQVELSGGTQVYGTILAPNESANISGGSMVHGRVIAQSINLSGGVQVASPEF